MQQQLLALLDELKAEDIVLMDVSELTTVTEYMIVCSGRSSRHVRAVADKVMEFCKEHGIARHAEGLEEAKWVLVDCIDVVVHVMLPEMREFYQLEKLWGGHWPDAKAQQP